MGLQRVRHDWAAEQQQLHVLGISKFIIVLGWVEFEQYLCPNTIINKFDLYMQNFPATFMSYSDI